MKQVKTKEEHIKLLQTKMKQLLDWPNPGGRIKDAYIPAWLKKECQDAIKGKRKEPKEE